MAPLSNFHPGFLAMCPPRRGEYPKKKNGIWIVGKLEFYVYTGTSISHGSIDITADMVDQLWKLREMADNLPASVLF